MGVKEAQQKIDSREFSEWIAYDRISPIGDDRWDIVAAIVADAAHTAFGGESNPEKFLKLMGWNDRPMGPEEMARILEGKLGI